MRSIVSAVLLAGSGVLAATPAHAQLAPVESPIQFAVEGRLSYANPFGQWNLNNDTKRGLGGGLNGQVWLRNRLGVYGGWESFSFKVVRPDLEEGVESFSVDRGFRLGLLTPYPLIGAGVITLMITGGGIYNNTSYVVHNERETFGISSNKDLGYEAGAGFEIPVGSVMLTPGVRYRTHKAVFGPPDETGPNETTVEYLIVDVGIRLGN